MRITMTTASPKFRVLVTSEQYYEHVPQTHQVECVSNACGDTNDASREVIAVLRYDRQPIRHYYAQTPRRPGMINEFTWISTCSIDEYENFVP